MHSFNQIDNNKDFVDQCLDLYHYQLKNNKLYFDFCKLINKTKVPKKITEIPFLPIQFFKTKKILTKSSYELKFLSSGTGGKRSTHYVAEKSNYIKSFVNCFESFFGSSKDYCFLALLPNYLDNKNSSLIYMMNHFINNSKYSSSNYYLKNYDKLKIQILDNNKNKIPTILFGVSFALYEFSKICDIKIEDTIVIETGGAKNSKLSKSKIEIIEQLKKNFKTKNVYSEYGMTEMLSQAYRKDSYYMTPKWLRFLIRDINNPYKIGCNRGFVNVIDLANKHSCPFIATEDFAIQKKEGIDIIGRLSSSELRGCNNLI